MTNYMLYMLLESIMLAYTCCSHRWDRIWPVPSVSSMEGTDRTNSQAHSKINCYKLSVTHNI